jgi:hypothetical protein
MSLAQMMNGRYRHDTYAVVFSLLWIFILVFKKIFDDIDLNQSAMTLVNSKEIFDGFS